MSESVTGFPEIETWLLCGTLGPTKERAFKEDGSRALYVLFSTWGLHVIATLIREGHPQKGVDLSYAPDRYGTNFKAGYPMGYWAPFSKLVHWREIAVDVDTNIKIGNDIRFQQSISIGKHLGSR